MYLSTTEANGLHECLPAQPQLFGFFLATCPNMSNTPSPVSRRARQKKGGAGLHQTVLIIYSYIHLLGHSTALDLSRSQLKIWKLMCHLKEQPGVKFNFHTETIFICIRQ